MRSMVALACVLAASVMSSNMFAAQEYPNKPIRIVTAESGSSLDVVARVAAQGLSASLGQQAVVDNRHILVIEIVAKAPPDGYTLLEYGSPMWIMPIMQEVTYDPVRDFAPISMMVTSPNVLVVHPAVAATSVTELIALAKAKPGVLNYGSSVAGGTPHLAAELFKSMAKVDIVRVAYRGVPPAVADLIAGRVQLMFPSASSSMPQVKAGKLRALAITSAQLSGNYPELPTIAGSGLPGYELVAMHGLFAPARTPVAIVNRLNQEVVRHFSTPEVKGRLSIGGMEAVSDTPAQFAATIKADMARLGKVVKEAGIRAE